MASSKKKWGFVVVGAVAAVALGAIAVAGAATNTTTDTASPSPAASVQADGQHVPGFDGDGRHGAPDGDGGHGFGRGGGFGGGAPDIAEALAELSGKDASDIMTQHEAGKTFAQIAKAEGVATDEVLARATAIEKAELNAAVKAGTLTDAQRAEILSGLQAHLKEELTEVHAAGEGHGSGRDGDGDGHGFGGAGSGSQAPSASSSPSTSGAALSY